MGPPGFPGLMGEVGSPGEPGLDGIKGDRGPTGNRKGFYFLFIRVTYTIQFIIATNVGGEYTEKNLALMLTHRAAHFSKF